MITVRTNNNLLVYQLTDGPEEAFRMLISEGKIPSKTIELKSTSKHSKGYLITEDYGCVIRGVKFFLWKGTQVLMT